MVLKNTLEEILYEIRNVNSIQRDSILKSDPSIKDGNLQELQVEEPQIEEPQIVEAKSNIVPTPIGDLLPTTQYFIVELHIRDEILTFDPSYQTYATKVMNHRITFIINYDYIWSYSLK